MRFLLRIATILLAWLLCTDGSLTADPLPRTVLVLAQPTPYTEFFGKLFASFQSTLKTSTSGPITVQLETLGYSKLGGAEFEAFLKKKYRPEPIAVIVAHGIDALQTAVALRDEFGPGVPIVMSGVPDTTAAQMKLPPHMTGATVHRTVGQALSAARALVPELEQIAMVGDRLEGQAFRDHYREQLSTIDKRVELIDLTGLPFNEVRKRVATLPQGAAIFYTSLSIGADGARYDPNDALALIAQVANRPIVVDLETRLGHGGTGGFLLQPAPVGEATAQIVSRLLGGESTSSIPIMAGEFVKPIFDWRELKRWNVSENRLPPGSEIRFREPGVWERYRLPIVGILAAFLLQGALIGWLIFEIGRRQRAEIQSRGAMAELTYMDRRASAEQRSATLAHEVNQPLAGIVNRAGAALRWVRAEKPDLQKVEAALEGIVAAGHRASDIVTSVRAMFKKTPPERVPTNINQIILTVLSIVRVELLKHRVHIQTQLNEQLPTVLGDKVQLQQVVLNLIMNSVEAMQSVETRVLKIRTDQTKPGILCVSIEDTGTGIDPSNVDRVFKPLFTTKESGMGMGLSICRSIIESHGGRIWVTPGDKGGSIFQFELPTNVA